jgi:hypothetical protein
VYPRLVIEKVANRVAHTAGLLPRRGRNKVDMEGEDVGKGIAGDAGTYGCLAIDNLYNVIHLSDRTSSIDRARITLLTST